MPRAPITAAQLAHLRTNEARIALQNDSVNITDPGGVVTTPGGGTTIADPVTTEDVPALVQSANARAVQSFFTVAGDGQQVVNADHLLMLPHGTTIRAGWSVTWGGTSYAVVDVAAPGTFGMYVAALLRKAVPVGG